MTDISTIVRNLKLASLGGAKIPHSISNPVIRVEEGKPVIAVFTYIYSRANLEEKRIPRPSYWLIADITTGEVIREFNCKEKDFTAESFGSLYDLNDPDKKIPSKDDFKVIYGKFELLRNESISKGICTKEMQEDYMNSIMEITPGSYRIFYKDLTNLY